MKYERLLELNKIWINIPNFFSYNWDLNNIKLFKENKIILRSSYIWEDSTNISFAWYFKSIWGIEKTDIQNILIYIEEIKKDAYNKIKDFNNFKIIIQEYIETDIWWVIFVENDKIFIEVSLWKWAEKVVLWNTESSVYIYKDFILETWNKLLYNKDISKLKKIIKNIKKSFNFNLDIEFWIKWWKIFIFQVRPITRNILKNYYLLDNSNIWENFTWTTSKLTASFVKRLYSKVYKSVAYNSWISYNKISKVEHIFDDLISYKNQQLFYNIFSWYKFLMLFPLDNKKSFDKMIWTNIKIKYLYIDDIYNFKPNILFKIKYFFIIIYKIITFDSKINKLEKYLKNFYKNFDKINLKERNLNDLYLLYKEFEQNLSFLWYITIDNDFVIMKLSKDMDLWAINWLFSANQIYFLKEVSEWTKTKQEYLEKYWHRFWDELKLEKWDISENMQDFEKLLIKYKNLEIKKQENKNLTKNKLLLKYIQNREKFRLYRSKNFSIARKIFLEIWEKFKIQNIIKKREDIFHFSIEDIFDKILSLNEINNNKNESILIWNSFKWKIYILKEFHIPNEKVEIIVAKSFDPWRITLLWWLKWIIIENWNFLSHISIVCRELWIPLLIWVKDVTNKYKSWDILKINSNWLISKK